MHPRAEGILVRVGCLPMVSSWTLLGDGLAAAQPAQSCQCTHQNPTHDSHLTSGHPESGEVPRSRVSASEYNSVVPAIPFHLAIPVNDLDAARRFYGTLLGFAEGRCAERWIDFDVRGHQLSVHLSEADAEARTNEVDRDKVPVRHFGLVLPWDEWRALGERLRDEGVTFLIEPHVRFEGQAGEQGTFFIRDPAGNALEMKSFRDPSRLFARDEN